MSHGFIKGVSVDVSYLLINDILEYNPPYIQSDFTCNPGPTSFFIMQTVSFLQVSFIYVLPTKI